MTELPKHIGTWYQNVFINNYITYGFEGKEKMATATCGVHNNLVF